MPRQHPIYVYGQDDDDYTTTGLVGDISPLSATFTEEKNGTSELVIHLPYDKDGRWREVSVGRIIRCEIPVRIPPVIADDEYANTVKVGGGS